MNDVADSGRPSLTPGLAVNESSLFLLVLYEPAEKQGTWRERILGGSIFSTADDAAASWGLRISMTKKHPKDADGYQYCEPIAELQDELRMMLETRGGNAVAVALREPFWEKKYRYAIVKTAFFG